MYTKFIKICVQKTFISAMGPLCNLNSYIDLDILEQIALERKKLFGVSPIFFKKDKVGSRLPLLQPLINLKFSAPASSNAATVFL